MDYKVSVIVPVYNVENYLAQCLKSITEQTLEEIEIICINDGSTDSSKKILEEFQKNDPRIFIVNKSNGGYGAACNAGLRISRGEYISVIEPDDFIKETMFEDLYTHAKKYDCDVVKSSFYEFSDETSLKGETIEKINWSTEYDMPKTVFQINDCPQLLYFHPSIWSCIYKKEFLNRNKITFVEAKGAGWVDNPFQVQTLALAKRIYYTDEAYYFYRLTNPTSSSNIVTVTNPFDRSDEVHEFLDNKNIRDINLLAHLYKRELSYIDTVLCGIEENLFDYSCKKIKDLIERMNENIIFNNKFVNDYEKNVYNLCKSKEGIFKLMQKIKQRNEKIKVTN